MEWFSSEEHAVEATTYLRKMRGGSQSSLIRASDGNLYILKLNDNPQGPNTLFHEALGSRLAVMLGLPVPGWAPIRVSEKFLAAHPEAWFETANGVTRPSSGLHFGSRFLLAEPGQSVYEILPTAWLARVRNRSDFLGMLVLDIWANHMDCRQALFLGVPGDVPLRAVFIDHGLMFGPTFGDLTKRIARGRFLNVRVYDLIGANATINEYVDRIKNIPDNGLRTAVEGIPEGWASSAHIGTTLRMLMRRRTDLVPEAQTFFERIAPGLAFSAKLKPNEHTMPVLCV